MSSSIPINQRMSFPVHISHTSNQISHTFVVTHSLSNQIPIHAHQTHTYQPQSNHHEPQFDTRPVQQHSLLSNQVTSSLPSTQTQQTHPIPDINGRYYLHLVNTNHQQSQTQHNDFGRRQGLMFPQFLTTQPIQSMCQNQVQTTTSQCYSRSLVVSPDYRQGMVISPDYHNNVVTSLYSAQPLTHTHHMSAQTIASTTQGHMINQSDGRIDTFPNIFAIGSSSQYCLEMSHNSNTHLYSVSDSQSIRTSVLRQSSQQFTFAIPFVPMQDSHLSVLATPFVPGRVCRLSASATEFASRYHSQLSVSVSEVAPKQDSTLSAFAPEFAPKQNSTLSVFAPEFAPIQDSNLSVFAPEFAPIQDSNLSVFAPEFAPIQDSTLSAFATEFAPTNFTQLSSSSSEFVPRQDSHLSVSAEPFVHLLSYIDDVSDHEDESLDDLIHLSPGDNDLHMQREVSLTTQPRRILDPLRVSPDQESHFADTDSVMYQDRDFQYPDTDGDIYRVRQSQFADADSDIIYRDHGFEYSYANSVEYQNWEFQFSDADSIYGDHDFQSADADSEMYRDRESQFAEAGNDILHRDEDIQYAEDFMYRELDSQFADADSDIYGDQDVQNFDVAEDIYEFLNNSQFADADSSLYRGEDYFDAEDDMGRYPNNFQYADGDVNEGYDSQYYFDDEEDVYQDQDSQDADSDIFTDPAFHYSDGDVYRDSDFQYADDDIYEENDSQFADADSEGRDFEYPDPDNDIYENYYYFQFEDEEGMSYRDYLPSIPGLYLPFTQRNYDTNMIRYILRAIYNIPRAMMAYEDDDDEAESLQDEHDSEPDYGASSETIEQCTVSFSYTSDSDSTDVDTKDECSICIDEFTEGVQVVRLPCKHLFHKECVHRWLQIDRRCALCRTDITSGQS